MINVWPVWPVLRSGKHTDKWRTEVQWAMEMNSLPLIQTFAIQFNQRKIMKERPISGDPSHVWVVTPFSPGMFSERLWINKRYHWIQQTQIGWEEHTRADDHVPSRCFKRPAFTISTGSREQVTCSCRFQSWREQKSRLPPLAQITRGRVCLWLWVTSMTHPNVRALTIIPSHLEPRLLHIRGACMIFTAFTAR